MRFGICTEGMEPQFLQSVQTVCSRFAQPTYLEIGVSRAETFGSMIAVLSEHSQDWCAIGIDPCIEYEDWQKNLRGFDVRLISDASRIKRRAANIIVRRSRDTNLTEHQVHLSFIDGCHCDDCVINDFKLVAKHSPVGAIAMFHDSGVEDHKHIERQHGEKTVMVRAGLRLLGLLDGVYPGWRTVVDMQADHRGLFVVERIS